MILSDEQISEVIQRDTTLWYPTKGEFLHEVGQVVAKAQDKQTRQDTLKEVRKMMAVERCDPDVMAYFNDYYWIDKSAFDDYIKCGEMSEA